MRFLLWVFLVFLASVASLTDEIQPLKKEETSLAFVPQETTSLSSRYLRTTGSSVSAVSSASHSLTLSDHGKETEEGEGHEQDDDGHDEDEESALVLLFLFFGLGMGVLLMQVFSKVGERIPYTCAVFIMGLVFSAASSKHRAFGKSVRDWVKIDADLLVYVFLPPLVFGEAMNLNWYHWKRGLLQACILAGPGVLLGAGFMGVITKMILPYDWDWNLAMVFGSILAATDTVAVVSLLKRVGAAPTLTNVIVGESLLNDGTAMVLFTIFHDALNGKRFSGGDIVQVVVSAIFGAILLGIVVGLVTVRWLRTANRPLKESDVLTQIAITICVAYLVFFLAEYVFAISGVLACVSAGAMLAWLAPPIILNHESMHNVWGMIEWALNTLIFLLAGLIIGHRVIKDVLLLDWIYLLVLYAVLMGVRALTITLLFPLFSGIGHRCTKKGAVFMSWAGLRGALGMALALLVEKHCPESIQKEASRLFFFVGGIAALTLIINAATAKPLLYFLELVGVDSAEKMLVMDQIKKKLRRKMDKVISQMAKEFSFTEEDLEEVRMSCTLLNDMNIGALYRDTEVVINHAHHNQSNAVRTPASVPVCARLPPLPYSSPSCTRTAAVHIGDTSLPANENSDDELEESFLADDDDEEERGDRDARRRVRATGRVSENSLRFPRDSRTSRSHSAADERRQQHLQNLLRAQRQGGNSRVLSSSAPNPQKSQNLLFASPQQAKSIHIEQMSRLLSVSKRGANPVIIQELLTYVRAVFLEIVRVKYWHFIEVGKLPRQSFSAQVLLYSIEVGLDEVKEISGSRDWVCLDEEIKHRPYAVRVLSWLLTILPECSLHTFLQNMLARVQARHEKRIVYMLTSFIEAQEHAQKKIHAFLGLDEDAEESEQSPEEMKVIFESESAIALAKKRLQTMNATTIADIRSKQAARLVLAKEAEMVKMMVHEGLLSPKHAEEFLEEIGEDTERIERDRNRLYGGKSKSNSNENPSIWSWFGFHPAADHPNSSQHVYDAVLHEPLIDKNPPK